MATFTWKNATSGSWASDVLWAGGAVPNDAQAVVQLSPPGPYTVSIPNGSSFTAASVTGGADVTLDIAGALSIAASSSLPATVIAATGRLSGQAAVKIGGTLANAGLISAAVPNTFFQLQQGTITNTGTLAAAATGTYLFLNNTTLTNLSAGVLTGGTYSATGQPLGGSVATIDFARSGISTEITTLAATVVLRFINSTLQGRTAAGQVRPLESTLSTIAPAGRLEVLGGRSYAGQGALAVDGRLELGGGALSAGGGLSVRAGGTLAGFGTVGTNVAVTGTVAASGGTLTLNGGLSGTGLVAVDKGATLVLPGGVYGNGFSGGGVLRSLSGALTLTGPVSGGLVFFAAGGSTLDLGSVGDSTLVFGGGGAKLSFAAAGFGGIVTGLQSGNVLEVKDVLASAAVASASGTDSLLSLSTANGSVSLRLAGDYSGKSFAVAPNGTGGTSITVAGVNFVPGPANWGAPTVTWSFATRNDLGLFAQFSSFVDPVAQADLAALWRAAFARWSAVSGLTFVEVADTPSPAGQADIRVGWGDFGASPTGEIGNAFSTFQSATRRYVPGTIVRLQDPAITPLSDNGGVLIYQNTVSSAYQVMLHEIGHALGLDHSSAAIDPAALMAPAANAANRDLGISDIAGIRALYAGVVQVQAAAISIGTLVADRPEGQAGATGFTFALTRSGDTAAAASVQFAVAGSGANPAAAADFQGGILPAGTIDFAPGETVRTLTIAVAGDTVVETDEGFAVTLANPTGASIAAAQASAAIRNDDASLAIAASGAIRPEGSVGTTAYSFTVTRAGDLSVAHSVGWTVAGIGANPAAASDFAGNVLPAGTVAFAIGQAVATITVAVAADTAVEADEGFAVTLANPSAGAAIALASAGATVLNDDTALAIAATAATVAEGTGAGATLTFTVTRTGDVSKALSATWTAAGSGANPVTAADLVGNLLPSGTVAFAPGETSRTITLAALGDSLPEADEGLSVALSNIPPGILVTASAATTTILNDDIATIATIDIAGSANNRPEGSGGDTAYTFTVTRGGDIAGVHAVNWAVAGAAGSGTVPSNAQDFVGGVLPSGTIGFAPGETSRTLTVLIAGDRLAEPNERFAVTLSAPSVGAVLGAASAPALVTNDDTNIAIAGTSGPSFEGSDGTRTYTYTITRSGVLSATNAVSWAVAGEGPIPATADDFAGAILPSGSVTFAPGETAKVITVSTLADTAIEPTEYFRVALDAPTNGATLGTGVVGSTIFSDDASVVLSATSSNKPEGTFGTTAFTFTLARTGGDAVSQSVGWTVTALAGNGTLPASADDFAGGVFPSGVIIIGNGETGGVITVAVVADAAGEANERFAINITALSPGLAIAAGSAQGIILNDDTSLSVVPLSPSQTEGNSGVRTYSFVVQRAGNTAIASSADWRVYGDSPSPADAGDFAGGVLPSGSIAFAPGETARTITVAVAGDTLLEPDETFQLALSNPSAGTEITVFVARSTILSDETSLSIAPLSASKPEGSGPAGAVTPYTFTVTRTGGTSASHSVAWSAAGSAGGGTVPATAADFAGAALPAGIASFAPGETSRVITVNVAAETLGELNERFAVTLSAPSAGASLGAAVAEGVILNDDSSFAAIAATASQAEGDAGSKAYVFTVQRSGIASATQGVSWSIAGTGAAPANEADFVGGAFPAGTLSFLPGQVSQNVTVLVAGDTQIEADEAFQLVLATPTGGASIATATATRTILGDDTALSIAALSASKPEGTGGTTGFTFTVSRTGGTGIAQSANWSVAGIAGAGTVPAAAADFAGGAFPAGTVSLAVGQASQVITVNVAAETLGENNERFAVTLAGVTAQGVIFDDDTRTSTAASETLTGTGDPDVFMLGGGLDTVFALAGPDAFRFLAAALGAAAANATTLEDFSRADGERLDLSRIDANAATPADDAFSFIGTAAFTGAAGQLRWEDQGTQRLIQGDVNGDGTAELTILVKAAGPVDSGWFIF